MPKKRKTSTITSVSTDRDRQRVPPELAAQFGQLGYVKWTLAYCPVLIVDPMKLAAQKCLPEGIYHAWMYKVDLAIAAAAAAAATDEDEDEGNLEDNNPEAEDDDHNSMPILVYWFGTTYEFSIVARSKVIPWDEGCEKGYDVVPEFMSRRMEMERTVPAAYQLCQDALEELTHNSLHLKREERTSAILSPKRKNSVLLNEWHALAMRDPPQRYAWLENRNKILERLPSKEYFGTIGFLPFSKKGTSKTVQHYHPVLVLSPFRVPPGPIRDEWFHKCSSNTQKQNMGLVYWFGAYTCGRQHTNGAYSFHNLNHIVSWGKGKQKGYNELPSSTLVEYESSGASEEEHRRSAASYSSKSKKKKPPKQEICWSVDWLVSAHWELEQALKKEPQDRWGGLEDFEEDYDDDFDKYWECIETAERISQMEDAKQKLQKESKQKSLPKSTLSLSKRKKNYPKDQQPENTKKLKNGASKKMVSKKRQSMVTRPNEGSGMANPQRNGDSPSKQQRPKLVSKKISQAKNMAAEAARLERNREKQPQEGPEMVNPQRNGDYLSKQQRPKLVSKKKSQAKNMVAEAVKLERKREKPPQKEASKVVSESKELITTQSKKTGKTATSQRNEKLAPKNETSAATTRVAEKLVRVSAKHTVSVKHTMSAVFNDTERPAFEPRTDRPGSNEELNDQVQSSTVGCAAVHQQEVAIATKQRRQERNSNSKRKEPENGFDTLEPNRYNSLAASSYQNDRLMELKRQKDETQAVVHQVIKEWTQKKMKSTS